MKIIGSDYDGTLSVGGITDEKIAAINQWRRSGNKFGVVTGRCTDFLEYLRGKAPDLELDFYACCSGGCIVDSKGRVIHETRNTDLNIKAFTRSLLDLGCKRVYVYGIDNRCIVDFEEDSPQHLKKEKIFLFDQQGELEYFNQITVELRSLDMVAEVAEHIRTTYRDRLTVLTNGRSIDIVPKGVNKAEGLYRVMEHFGGSKEDIIAVGDNFNDIDMLREFHSYAMESGINEIKAITHGVVGDVTEIFEYFKVY